MRDDSQPAYFTFWVRAGMNQEKKLKKVKKQTGVRQVEKKKSLFSSEKELVSEPVYEAHEEWVGTGIYSDTHVDIGEFSERVAEACNELHRRGYEVISVVPVIAGRYAYKASPIQNSSYGYGYGYSVTDGVTIVGKLKE